MTMTLKGSAVSPKLCLGSVTRDQMPVKDKTLTATGFVSISVRELVRDGMREGENYKIIL